MSIEEYWASGKMFREVMEKFVDTQDGYLTKMVDSMKGYIESDHYYVQKGLLVGVNMELFTVAREIFLATIGMKNTIQELLPIVAKRISGTSEENKLVLSAQLIGACNGTVYNMERDGDTLYVISIFKLSQEEKEIYDLSKYIPPQLEVPPEWSSNTNGGYRYVEKHVILGKGINRHDGKQCLDVLNQLQSIGWRLDPYIVSMEEEANKEEFETAKEQQQWELSKERARELYKEYLGRVFYFPWRVDKRGRQYMGGYHINLQSTGYKKALMDFAEPYQIEGEL